MAYGLAFMRALKAACRKAETNPVSLAKRIGWSRATWFNKLNGTYEVSLEEAEHAALALESQFLVILDGKDVLSGVPVTLAASGKGASLPEHIATVVGLMSQLSEKQQEQVQHVVESTLSAMGFGQPGGSAGPRAARRKLSSGPRT